ncbi:MAG: LPD5 domain-containing protein, partial [Bacteroidales bacterium]|nr:LPD5 domain-containing protein [Bacteroidales bacterium]
MDNSEVKKLYDALIKKGYTTRDLGDAGVFAKKISDEQNRKQLYDYVVRRGDFRIGDYDTYERRLTGGAKKTDGGGAVSAAAPTSTTTPTTAMGPKPTETLPGPKKPVVPDGFVTSVKMPTDGGTITGADKKWTIPTTDVPEETTEGAVPGVPDKPLTEQDKIRLSVGLNNMNKRHEATMDALKGNLDNMTEWAENVKIGEDVAEGKPMFNPESGEMEKTYITPTARRYFDSEQATAEASRFREAVDMTTSGRLRRAQRELIELQRKAVARSREISETHKPDGSSLLLSRDPYANEYLNDKELRMLNVAITEKEKTIGELEDQLRRDRGEDPGLWHQVGRVMSDPEVLTFGLESMRKWSTIKNSKPDDSSTPEEDAAYQEMLSAINENEQTAAEFADNWSNWERWGQIFGHVPFFGAELLLTGGGFKGIKLLTKMGTKLGAKAIGKEAAEEMAKQGVIKYIKSNGWKGVGNAALNGTIKSFGVAADELLFRAPLVVNTIHMPQTIADIYDRKYGDIVENEKGELGFANDKNWSTAIWESEADNTIEVYSEMFGEHLDGVMSIKGWQKASEVLGLKRLSGVLAKAEAGELGTIINTTRKWLGKAGVNSYIGEVGEEYYGQLLRTGVNLDEAYRYNEDGTRTNLFFDSQWQGDIWGGMLISQGLLMLPGHAISAGRYMYMKHRVNRADARAAEAIGAETWGALRDIIDNTTNDSMGEMAVSIMNDASMSQDARDAAINYIGASLRMRGFNLGTMAQGRNGTLDNDAQALNESYVDGYNAVSAQERNDANNMYNRQRERVLEIIEEESLDLIDSDVAGALDLIRESDLDEEQRGIVLEYLNAKQVRDGMMQRVRDDIDGRIEQSNAMVDARTNKNTGMIHPATMKQDNRKVYIVSGSLVQYDDKSGIDNSASDDSIIVRDAETGKLEQVSPDAILNVDETIDPAQEKETTAEQIRLQYARQAANDIDGVITFNAGDTYEIPGAVQGQTISLSIVANEEGIVDNGDGTVNVSMGGRVFPMAKESLQAQVNAVKMQRIYDFERKRAEENLLGQQQSQSQSEQPQTETPAPTPAPQQSTPTPTPQEPIKFNMDDEVTLRDADGNTVQGRIISGEEDGRYQVETDTPLNGRVINNLTADEISGMLIEHNGEAIAQPEASPQETPATPQQETPAPQQEQSAYERVPKNENEEPLYEQTDSDTAWDAIVEQTEGDEEMAQAVADSMVADKEAELKKIEKPKPKAGATIAEKIAAEKEHKEAIAAAQQAVDAWKKIAGTTSRRKSAAEAEAARAAAESARARKAEEDRLRAEREEAERVEREKLNGVPDMTEDIPADARARGYRRVNGHIVERQQPVGGLRGKEVDVKFSDKEMPKGRVAVIEAEELQPSHLQGQRNPLHFIDEAQPKDRNDAASVASSRKIAGNIRPEEITTSVTAYTGAPTVNSRGEVIQGNSRSDALRLMWEAHPEQAAKYKQYLIDHAEEFGLNPEEIAAMKHPVLVGMLDAKDEDAIRLGQYVAQDTESGGIERIKPKNAVQKMGNDMRTFANRLLATADDDMSISALIDANGVDVLKWMNEKGYITPTQYKSAFDSRGNLTEEAKNDLRGIMYQSIFKGAPTSLEEMFNKLPIKAQRAILATAYRDYDSSASERMIKEIQNSIMACYALLQTSDFAKATTQEQAMYAIEAWKRQYQIDDATGESYIPAKKFSNFALHLAMMYKVCSQNTIQGTFNKMYDLIQGTQAANLFEAPDNTPRTLAQAIKETLNIDYNGQNGSDLLAGDNTASQGGEQGSPRDTKSGESDEGGERTANSGARTDGNGEQVERPKKGGEQRAESGEATVERQKPQNSNVPTLFDAITTLYEKGKEVASKIFQRTYFYVARTPKFMQELGLRGDKFTIKYGVISRHLGKDGSHTLTEKEWTELPDALQKPFAISKITDEEDSYRIYTTLQTGNGEYVVVGVDVKNAGREIEVNAISTVFGRRDNANLPKNEKVIYRSEEITPEQSSLLERPNYARYPNAQELSVDKGRKKSGTVQEPEGEKDMLRRKWETMKRKMPEGTVFIVEHNGRYYAFGDDATRVNAALTGKGDAARTDYISLDEKQYNDVIEVLDLKGFSIASYSAKDIKEEEQPVEGLPDKLQSIVRRLLGLKSEMDRYREIGNKAEGKEALEADEKYDELNNEASEFVKSLDMLSLEELNKVFDALGEKRYAFEWDFAKLFDKKKTDEAQMRNREKARAAVQAVMDADLPKVKVGNPKFNIHNYTDGTSKSTPAIGGIFHDNGYAVATDTHIVVASKEDYDAEHEGQLVTKDGDVLNYKFPKWRLVLNPDTKAMENPMSFDCDALLGFIASVEAKLKADKMGPKKIAGTMQLVRLPNGDVGAVDLSTLKKFAIAAKHFGAKEIAINGRRGVIYTSTEKGSVMIYFNLTAGQGHYDYEEAGKTTFGFDMSGKKQREQIEQEKAKEENGENANPAPKDAVETTVPKNSQKIEDFGEKINGARKNLVNDIVKKLEQSNPESFAALQLTKAFSRPKIKELIDTGAITEKEAVYIEALSVLVLGRKKPVATKRYGRKEIEEWANEQAQVVEKIKSFIETDADTRAEIISSLKKEYEQCLSTGEAISPVAFAYAVIERAGLGDKSGYKPVDLHVKQQWGKQYTIRAGHGYVYVVGKNLEEAVSTQVAALQIKNGVSDVEFPMHLFKVSGRGRMYVGVGTYEVIYNSKSRTGRKTELFQSKEEAEAFAKNKKDAYVVEQTKTQYTSFEICIKDPVSHTDVELGITFESKEEANAYIEEHLLELSNKAAEKIFKENKTEREGMKYFEVHKSYVDGKYFVTAMGMQWILDEFDTIEEAKQKAQELEDEYKKLLEEQKKIVYFSTKESKREGKDWRDGKDATPEMFMKAFGFRGVQFGNWTNARDRQEALNQAYDAFMDLAEVLGKSPKTMSLNGELGLAFGARGSGSALAHYEPGEVVINLTKTKGAGSLAHEWWHALDNYLSRRVGVASGFATALRGEKLREELKDVIGDLLRAIDTEADYGQRSRAMGAYWGSTIEITARLFAEYVNKKIRDKGEKNAFLSRGVSPSAIEKRKEINWRRYQLRVSRLISRYGSKSDFKPMTKEEFMKSPDALAGFPHPTDVEVEKLSPYLDKFFAELKESEEMLYHKAEGKDVEIGDVLPDEAAMRDALIDRLEKSGIQVVTESEEAQAVLDAAKGDNIANAKKRALETVSVTSSEEHLQTVVSSADGAKVLNNLDNLAKKIEETIHPTVKTFIGDAAEALGAKRKGSGSQYATFETVNGKLVTIRLSDHNAKVSNFDNNGEFEGISIVISAKGNNGVIDDGDAHITEYYYDSIKLRKSKEKPLAEIVRSIKQALYSGEFNDTTGLAERQEVNMPQQRKTNGIKLQKREQSVEEKQYKEKQLEIINKSNPAPDSYHTWLRSTDDILTLQEAVDEVLAEDEEYELSSYPDVSDEMIREALRTGKIRVYSSKPIKNGVFVTPSMMQAKDYAGRGAVYSKEVPISDVAWINTDEGQYAATSENANEKDTGIKYFRTSNGEVYGFTDMKKIYIDRKIAGAETPIHEYTHLWAQAMRNANPEEWRNIIELMRGTNEWEQLKKNYPELTTDDEVAEEVLAHYSGRRGAERLRAEQKKVLESDASVLDKAAAVDAIERVKQALSKFWKAVSEWFDFHFTSAEEVADKVLYDMLNGENFGNAGVKGEYTQEEREIIDKAKADGTYMKAPNGKPTKLTEKQWVQVRTKAFKKWFGDWELAAKVLNVVPGVKEHGFKNFDEARQWAKEHIVRILTNAETGGKGEIRISNNAVSKFLSESAVAKSESKDVHLSVLKVLPDVIRESVDAEQHPDFKKGNDGNRSVDNGVNEHVTIHRLYGAVSINGQVYRVKVTIKSFADANRTQKAYSYEATKIELLAGTLVGGKTSNPSTNNSIMVANLLQNAEKSYGNGEKIINSSKVVDENGEPLVVYHGSPTGTFNVFGEEKGDSDSYSVKGAHFLTSSKRVADGYSAKTHYKNDNTTDNDGHRDMAVDDSELELFERYEEYGKNKGKFKDYGVKYRGEQIPNSYSTDKEDALNKARRSIASNYYTRDSKVYECFVNLKNPYVVDAEGKLWHNVDIPTADELKAKGYDGVIVKNVDDSALPVRSETATDIVAFEPTQIKSATDNVGTFDAENRDIRYQFVGKVIWHTPKDVTTSSAERQGLDYEQLNMAETATKGSGITPQRTPSYGKDTTNTSTNNASGENNDTTLFESDDTMYRVRTDEPPTKTGTGYKVFVLKNGKLYPPMVANPGGDATPVGIWLDADAAPITGQSKTGRDQVKAGGKGTQGGSGSLAYRPGWHLGEIPYALQFNRKDENGEKTLFPGNFVWAEVEYANDVDYQEEAMQYGYTEKGKFRHSYAGLPRLPINGAYRYRTNPNPETDPWIITGAMRVKRLLTPSEVDNMVMEAGREPQRREANAITDADIETLNKEIESNSSTSQEVMAARVRELAEKLNLGNVDIVTDANALDGKKATAKGFYSKSTGRITIVIPNNANVADVEQTLLHEAVAHYGLRQLFGEHFDTFLDNVFNNASEEVRRKIVELAAKNGWDFRKATEEYLATLAESTEFEKIDKGFWRQVKNFFLEMLDKIGLKGFSGVTLTDNELRYILWRSYENLTEPGGNRSVFGEAADIAKQYELQVGNYASENSNDETLFRDGDPVQRERVLARDIYERRVSSGMYQTVEALQDSMLSIKEAMKLIAGEKYIENIDGFENAYMGENRLSSTNQAEVDAFAMVAIKPMLEEIATLARNEEEYKALTDYMMAKHGLERNEYMRAEAIKRGEIGANERDFAGLTALTGTSDTYVAEQMAKRMVSDYEQDHDTTALWEKVNAVSKALLQKSYDCGMMNKETYEKVRDMYEYYIPLRGFDEATGEDVYSYLSSNNRIGAPLLKTAKGRKSKADDPIANLCLMADSTIMQGNRNKLVKQRFLNFVLNHPSDLVSVSDLWLEYDNVNDEWIPVFPDNIESYDSPEDVERKMQEFETKMRELAKQYPKRYKRSRDAKDMPYRILEKRDMREHIVIVKRNGRDYVLIINGNPRAAQAVNGLTNPDSGSGTLLGPVFMFFEAINRWISALYTTMNPDFVASNFVRDLQYTNSMVWVKESPNYAMRYQKNYARVNPAIMLRLIKKHSSGKLNMNDKLEAQFYEFMMNGGETGIISSRTIEQHK